MRYESEYYGVQSLPFEGYLQHHGIKGQKWGVRRFQNKDNTLTAAGKARYGSGTSLDSGSSENTKPAKKSSKSYDHSQSSGVKKNKVKMAARIATHVALTAINPAYALDVADDIRSLAGAATSKSREEKAQQAKEGLKTDKATGLKLKDPNKTYTEKDDMKAVNPGFHNFDDNTKNNCMLCTMAYEMRRRGYEVTANKASYGYGTNDTKRWFPKAEIKKVDDYFDVVAPKDRAWRMRVALAQQGINYKLAKQTKQALLQQGDGARGNLMVNFSNGGGHSMVYEIKKNKFQIRDCQSGKLYRNPSRILRYCTSAGYARLDNVDFDKKRIKEVAG